MQNDERIARIKLKIKEIYGEIPSPHRSYLVCSSPRTGTNLIGFGLKEIGYGWPLEGYNLSGNKKYGWGHDQSDIIRYTIDIINYQTSPKSNIFGLKLFWEQFMYLEEQAQKNPNIDFGGFSKHELLKIFFDKPYYMFLQRKNKIKQAISYVKAIQSNTFLVPAKNQSRKQVKGKSELVYDRRTISHFIERYVIEDMLWERFFAEHKIQPYHIWYEDFVQDYEGSMRQLISFFGLDQVDIPLPYSKKQADSINEEWYQKYLKDNPWIQDPLDGFKILSDSVLLKKRPAQINRPLILRLLSNPGAYFKTAMRRIAKR